ncbi:hypothetical protein OAQ99_04295 [Candidatus Kapabacteria bacterium]|nr:hypothetical protein [Candidatus Kapabacteria bacterium]
MKKLVLIVIFLGLISCEYEPTGSNFKEVNPVPEPLDLDLTITPENSNIWLTQNEYDVWYDIQWSNKEFLEGYYYLDSNFNSPNGIKRLSSTRDQIELNTEELEIGSNHLFTIELHFASETGSLGDIVGAERFIIAKQWQINIFDKDDYTFPAPNANQENGSLNIEWEKPNFNDIYQLQYRKLAGSRLYSAGFKNIKDSINNIIDDKYVGEYAKYILSFTDVFGHTIPFDTLVKETEFGIYQRVINDTTAEIYWNKCNYPENFGEYQLTFNNNSSGSVKITDINDTSYTVTDFRVGSYLEVDLVVTPKGGYNFNFYSNEETNIVQTEILINGEFFPESDYTWYVGKDKIFYQNDETIGFFNTNTLDIDFEYEVESRSYDSYRASLNGDYFIHVNDDIATVVDTRNYSVKQYNPQEVSNNNVSNGLDFWKVELSNNGVAVFYFGSNAYFYNIIDDSYLFKHENLDGQLYFDKDGEYIYEIADSGVKKYKFSNSKIEFIEEWEEDIIRSSNLMLMSPNDKNKAYLRSGYSQGLIYELDLGSMTSIDEYPNTTWQYANLYENVYWDVNDSIIEFFDLDTRSSVGTMDVANNSNLKYQNGYLLYHSGSGLIFKADYK